MQVALRGTQEKKISVIADHLDENANGATTPLDSSNRPIPKLPLTPLTHFEHPVHLMMKVEAMEHLCISCSESCNHGKSVLGVSIGI
jgi:hypothetical protein